MNSKKITAKPETGPALPKTRQMIADFLKAGEPLEAVIPTQVSLHELQEEVARFSWTLERDVKILKQLKEELRERCDLEVGHEWDSDLPECIVCGADYPEAPDNYKDYLSYEELV